MPLKLTGIVSENDFYTSHYMSAVLEDDIKSVFARWSEADPSPAEAIQKLRHSWQVMRRDLDEAADPASRMEAQRPWLRSLCEALGYEWHPQIRVLEDGMQIPIVGEITRANGAPELWLIEVVPNGKELDDPLALPFRLEQFPPDAPDLVWPEDDLLEDLIAEHIFSGLEPPRWLLLFHAGQLVLLDRSKWAQRRLLRFDFAVIFKESRDVEARYFAALAARESVPRGRRTPYVRRSTGRGCRMPDPAIEGAAAHGSGLAHLRGNIRHTREHSWGISCGQSGC